MENETGKLSFDRLFLLSGIYALFYTVCLYKNKMGITFPVFVLGTAGLFQYYLRLTGRTLKKGSALYLGGILLLGLNVCLTTNEIVILFDKGFIFLLFFMLFLHNLYDDSAWDVSKYALSLCCPDRLRIWENASKAGTVRVQKIAAPLLKPPQR